MYAQTPDALIRDFMTLPPYDFPFKGFSFTCLVLVFNISLTTSCSTLLLWLFPRLVLLVTWSCCYVHFPLFQISSLNHLISLSSHPIHKLNIYSLTVYNRFIQPSVYLACFLCCFFVLIRHTYTYTYSPLFTFLASPSSSLFFFSFFPLSQ